MRALVPIAVVSLLVGCTGKSQTSDPRSCPPGEPSPTSVCAVESLRCTYGAACGSTVICTSGAWQPTNDGCGDAATPSCPSTAPRSGESCSGSIACPYPCGDGGTLTASCASGSWKLVASGCALP